MTDKINKMISWIFMFLILAIMASCLTQESLAPSASVISWMVHFLLILGIWLSYYIWQMLAMCDYCEDSDIYVSSDGTFLQE